MADLGSPQSRQSIHKAIITFSFVLLLTVLLLTSQITIAQWSQKVSAKARISLAGWLQPSPTPSSTPFLPAQAGATLIASITASGFADGAGGAAPSVADLEPSTGVRGEICVANQGQFPTDNLSIATSIQFRSARGGPFEELLFAALDAGDYPVVGPGERFCYAYEIRFLPPRKPVLKYRMGGHVTITNHADWLPGDGNCPGPDACPFGPTVSEDFTLPQLAPTAAIGPINPLPTQMSTPLIPEPTQTAIIAVSSPTPLPSSSPTQSIISNTPSAQPEPSATHTLAPSSTPDSSPTSSLIQNTPSAQPKSSATPTLAPSLAPTQYVIRNTPTPSPSVLPNTPTPTPTLAASTIGNIDLSLAMTDGQLPALPGGLVIYALNYANYGTLPAGRVILTEWLPANTVFNPEASSPGWIQTEASDEYIYPIGELPAGGSASLTFAVTIDQHTPAGVYVLTNTAHISAGKVDSLDLNPADNTATITTPITTPSPHPTSPAP